MERTILRLLANFISYINRFRKLRLAAILVLPVLLAGTAFTVFRWSVSGAGLLEAHAVPVTGNNSQNQPVILSLLETATSLPFSQATPTLSHQPAAPKCNQPNGWVPYLVSPMDSLYRLSVTYGMAITDLQQANCLDANSLILPGQVIYVPDLLPGNPEPPTPTSTPTNVPFPFSLPVSENSNSSPANSQPSAATAPTNIPIPPPLAPKPVVNTPIPPTLAPKPVVNTPIPPANTPKPHKKTPKPKNHPPPKTKPKDNKHGNKGG